MAGLDEVMERLLADQEFRALMAADPASALAGYTLSDDDREVLASTLTYSEGRSGVVEQRTTQSTVAGLLSAFEGVLSQAGPSSAAAGGHTGGVHVAISLGDGKTIEAGAGAAQSEDGFHTR